MTGRRLRVLQAVPDLDYGGLQRLVVDTCQLLPADRFESAVLSFAGPGPLAERLPAGVPVYSPPPMSRLSLLRPVALARLLREIEPDVVHSHSGIWLKTARAARMAGVPRIIHTDHGRNNPDPWDERLVDHLASRLTDVTVAVSEVLAAHVRAKVVSHPERLRVIINGVDTDRFAPGSGSLRAELGVGPERPIIGSIGRFEPIKGYDLMIEAFAVLVREWTGPSRPLLVLVGDGTERAPLEQRTAELGLTADVRFLGFRADSPELLRDFTIFALGSRSEGTSVSLLEALSSGVCPVVTDVGGNRNVLGPELAHRLAPPLDPPGIAGAWRKALLDPQARAVDVRVGRARVEAGYSLRRMVNDYAELYLG